MEKTLFFAYGSLMDIEKMADYCPDAKPYGTGWLTGGKLRFKGDIGKALVTIETASETSKVPVVAWEISKADMKAIEALVGFPENYYKHLVWLGIKEAHTGIVSPKLGVTFVRNHKAEIAIPSEEYYNLLVDIYQNMGFPTKILKDAFDYSACYIHRKE